MRKVQRSLFECLEHQGASLEEMWAYVRAITGGAVLPDMLSVNEPSAAPRFVGLEVERIPLSPRDGKSELMLAVNIRGNEVTRRLDFDLNAYAPATAQWLARAFETVLGRIIDG